MEVWERIIERHGLAVAFLVVTIAALYLTARHIIVPLINKLLAALEKQADEARVALNAAQNASREARKEDQKDFLDALARRDRAAEEQARAFQDAMRKIDEQKGRG